MTTLAERMVWAAVRRLRPTAFGDAIASLGATARAMRLRAIANLSAFAFNEDNR